MSALVFMDTETTGLSLDDDIWEFAAIRREEDGTETELHIFIEHDRDKCRQLPMSFLQDHYDRFRDHRAYTPRQAASEIASLFRNGKPHVVGAVPDFDTTRIAKLLRGFGLSAGWHYHLIDVENLAVGYLAGRAPKRDGEVGFPVPKLPWDSDHLSLAVGVDPGLFERHTAMGDVKWAMAIYDAVMSS